MSISTKSVSLMLAALVTAGAAGAADIATTPQQAPVPAGTTYTNEAASVVWAFNSAEYKDNVTTTPEAFNLTSVDDSQVTYIGLASTTMCPDITFVKLRAKTGGSDVTTWSLKPAKGLTFTPTKVTFYISRDGTDGDKESVTVKGRTNDGAEEIFAKITPHRNGKSKDDDKFGNDPSYTIKFDYNLTPAQQTALTSGSGFSLVMNNGYATNKSCMYSDVQVHGLLNGTVEQTVMCTFSAVANPAEAGNITITPNLAEVEKGTEVTVKAEKNFGYSFVNWTDATGAKVSDKPQFAMTVNDNTALTANFKAIETYELKYGVDGGANPYQVQPSPAPTIVDGKNMYEAGAKVTLKAISNPIMNFSNWSDGQSMSEITFTMDSDKEYTGVFSAADFVTGWDFYLSGNNGRPADFFAEDNDAATLILRDAEGNLTGWLDKSQQAAGGYEGRPAGVNWKTEGLGKYYWQTTVNASAFTDLKLEGAMTFNYNAYSTYNVEASLDGTEWTKIGSVTIEGAKQWKDYTFNLPAKYNNAASLSIRWIADKSSEIRGTESKNDGIAIGATYITGTPKLINDGTAPVLLSYVPAEGSDNASITGKIVLNFDEKVKMAAGAKGELAGAKLEPTVTGKTVTFPYKNLAYGTEYTFTLPAGAVMDLCDNATTQAISIKFTTRTKPEIEKALYDFIVPDDGTIGDAVAAAEAREDVTKRFRIFFRNGKYVFPLSKDKTKTGADGKEYADPTTYISTPNISFIGESTKGVVITNAVPGVEIDTQYGPANVLEGIGKGDVLRLEKKATGCYFQNLTLKSAMGDSRGRDIVLNDNSDKTIFKDACLWAFQDTYVSNNENGRFYFEGGVLRGRTDFVCGKGDVYYQAVNFQVAGGGYISAPSKPKQHGYIFNECEITGETSATNGKFTLGRPWGSGTPIALFINTVMKAQPSAEGWNEMSGGWPARMAEYNSVTAAGTPIDLSKRKKIFAQTHENNPVLSKNEAEWFTIENVLGQDGWDPAMTAEQAPEVTGLKSEGYVLSWDNNNYTSLWAVCGKNGIIGFTTEPKFEIPAADFKAGDTYGVRAANEMGGLGAQVDVTAESGISSVTADSEVVSTAWYNLQGIRVAEGAKGILIKVETLANGQTVTSKTVVE